MRTLSPKVVSVYTQVKSVRSSLSTGVSDFFFPWHVQPLFLGVESLFVCLKSVRREKPEAVWHSCSWSISFNFFPRLQMPSAHFFFFSSTKNLPAAPDVFLIHFWQVEKSSVAERRSSQGQQVAVSGAVGAGRGGCGSAGALCPCPLPTTAPSVGMFLCQQGWALCPAQEGSKPPMGIVSSTVPASQQLLPGMLLPTGGMGEQLFPPGHGSTIAHTPSFIVTTPSFHKACSSSSRSAQWCLNSFPT